MVPVSAKTKTGLTELLDVVLLVAELEKEFEGKAIFEKINVDENGGEAGKYGVMSIPTYVMEKNGKEVDRLIGGRSKEAFKRWIESHI